MSARSAPRRFDLPVSNSDRRIRSYFRPSTRRLRVRRSSPAHAAAPCRRRPGLGRRSKARPSARCSRSSSRQHPGLAGQVLTEDGSLHRFVNVYVNDDDVRYLDKLDTKVGAERRRLDPAGGRRRRD